MAQLYAGFSRVDITPEMGIDVVGYYIPRKAEGVLDPLMVRALALQMGDQKVVMLSADLCYIAGENARVVNQAVAEATGLPEAAIYYHCTHTHTGPATGASLTSDNADTNCPEVRYVKFLAEKSAEAAKLALADLKPATVGYGIGQAPNIAFVRRFRMKDGSVRTNPGVNNPDIVAPIGDVDERVSVVRFDREGAETLVLVNFADHPDTVGGCKISADWPGLTCGVVEKVLDNTKCILFNGAQGDVNHVNVRPTGGYLNNMFMDFDDVSRGYAHAQYMARVVTGGVLQAFDKVQYFEPDSLRFAKRTIRIPSNMPDPAELPEAHRITELHEAGKDNELPYTGMMLTTVVARSKRMVLLENGPEAFELRLSALSIGDVAFVGIPGEPFTGVGRGLKETEGWDLVIPTCLTNGAAGYFPMMECYVEGGYEAGSSKFKAGVAEQLIEEGQALLAELKKG